MSKKIPLMFAALLALAGAAPQGGQTIVTPATIQKLATELATKYGESERSRIERGLNQAARFWRKEDGDEAAFAEVARARSRRTRRCATPCSRAWSSASSPWTAT